MARDLKTVRIHHCLIKFELSQRFFLHQGVKEKTNGRIALGLGFQPPDYHKRVTLGLVTGSGSLYDLGGHSLLQAREKLFPFTVVAPGHAITAIQSVLSGKI